MFSCPNCQQLFLGVNEFKHHLIYIHNYGHSKFSQIICPFSGCSELLNTWSWFLRHIKAHESSPGSPMLNTYLESNLSNNLDFSSFNSYSNESNSLHNSETFENITVDTGIKIVSEILGNFCSSILANGVNNTKVDFIINEMKYLFTQIIDLISKIGVQQFGEQL